MLDYGVGSKVRVVQDNDRSGLLGHVGTVRRINEAGVSVEFESDPARRFRSSMILNFSPLDPNRRIWRFFGFNDVEVVSDG